MNRTEIKIEKDVFEEVMYTDYIEWGTLLENKINDFWLENEDFQKDLLYNKIPKQLDNWYKEFSIMYRSGKLDDNLENAMYEFLGLTPQKYITEEIMKAYKRHVQETINDVNKVLDKLNKNGVVLLEFYGYSTKDEDIEQDNILDFINKINSIIRYYDIKNNNIDLEELEFILKVNSLNSM